MAQLHIRLTPQLAKEQIATKEMKVHVKRYLQLNTTLNREFHAVQNGRIPLFTSATVRIRA